MPHLPTRQPSSNLGLKVVFGAAVAGAIALGAEQLPVAAQTSTTAVVALAAVIGGLAGGLFLK